MDYHWQISGSPRSIPVLALTHPLARGMGCRLFVALLPMVVSKDSTLRSEPATDQEQAHPEDQEHRDHLWLI